MYYKQILYKTNNAKVQEMSETGKDNIPKIFIQEHTYSSHKSIQVMQGVNKYKNCFVVLSNCVNVITSKYQHVNTSRMQILKKTKGSDSSLGRIVCLNMHSRSKVVSVTSLHVHREDISICICSGSVSVKTLTGFTSVVATVITVTGILTVNG